MSNPASKDSKETLPLRLTAAVEGSYKKTTLLQKRVRELIRGQRALYETRETDPIEIALEELNRGLIELVPDEIP